MGTTERLPAQQIGVYTGDAMAGYGFGADHPFGLDRFGAFAEELASQGLDAHVTTRDASPASPEAIADFHDPAHIARVERLCKSGYGFLDVGDTPARSGGYEAACAVVGASLDALKALMSGALRRAFIPIGGLHHATRTGAAGFCIFNDCGVVIEALRKRYGITRTCYIDIDVHHGDGVFYAFESDPDAGFADIHQDGRTLYPGTGHAFETGKADAKGTKLNLPLLPGATDDNFRVAWAKVAAYVDDFAPEFILFQCGADGLAGDPIAGLAYTEEAHRMAATGLCELAERHAKGRILAWGGGGYNRRNLARAWCAVVSAFIESPAVPVASSREG